MAEGNPAIVAESGCMRLKRARHGLMLYNTNDVYIGRSFDLYGEFSHLELALLAQLLRPGMTVVDIGANIGAHTLGFARAVGEMGNVIAFEPQRVVFETLCANLALNALFHVRPLMSGVGRERGAAALPAIDPRQKRNFGGISLGAAGTEAVPVTPLDALGLKACHLVKIDVEGMEGDVIAGAAETIGRCRPLLYLENDRRDKSAALIAQAMGLGYRLYWHLPPLYNPANWYANAENVFGRVLSVNLLALPQEAVVKVEGLRPVSGPEDKADHW